MQTEFNNKNHFTIIIFGATGDLTKRKLLPSFYHQFHEGQMPEHFKIIAFARRPYSTDDYLEFINKVFMDNIEHPTNKLDDFFSHIDYIQGDVTTAEAYDTLKDYLQKIEDKPSHRLYYLATAPQLYEPIITHLGEKCLNSSDDLMRNIVIEKPFGNNLESAKKLNDLAHKYFKENQIFRIDHYLGKETAQNILFFRFANSIFEPLWNRRYIDSVHINVEESGTIHHRAGYYDKAGILRDMFQNHLLQLLTLIAMEPPANFEAQSLQYEKIKVLQSLRPADPDYITLGQYEGYLEAPGVATDSRTPTYGLIPTYIDNWRWQGVPFYLRSGKALKEKTSQITIEFRCPPHLLFDKNSGFQPNKIIIQIQPNEGIRLQFETKQPNSPQETITTSMDFNYETGLKDLRLPTAYERLLMDALMGDTSLFTHAKEIELSWSFIDPIIQHWNENTHLELKRYSPGEM